MTDVLSHETLHSGHVGSGGGSSVPHAPLLLLLCLLSCVGVLLIRLSAVLPMFHPRGRGGVLPTPARTLVIWGSGGHTTEMLLLLQALFSSSSCYAFHCLMASSDHTTRPKIATNAIVQQLLQDAIWHDIARSREVKQSWFTTIFTTLFSFLQAFVLVGRIKPHVILANGPGTCVPLCYAAFLWNLIGWTNTKIIFIESFCRVEKLSLTGKLLYVIADRFVLQWPHLLTQYPRAEYLGDLQHR